jgi:transcriptional regulator with XRE-family HTH domain
LCGATFWRVSNGEGWSDYLADLMRRAGFANAADLSRASGIDQTQISRWLRGHGQPSLDNLRRLSPVVRRPMLELAVRAGHFTSEEARLKDLPSQPLTDVDLETAIEQAPDLIDEAKQHLLNQYDLLRRLSDVAGSKSARPGTPARVRPLPAAARRGKPDRS